MTERGYSVRKATPEDVSAIAALFRRVRQEKLPYLPNIHSPAEERTFFADLVNESMILVAESQVIVGFIGHRPGWIDHLYVDGEHAGRGIGSSLLGKIMESENALELWAFQKNHDAIGFYRSRGFEVVMKTDGSGNEEHEPDLLMRWNRASSSAYKQNAT